MNPPTTFPLFPRLPPELRHLIWELCLPQRIIPLSALVLAHRYRDGHRHHHHQTLPREWHVLLSAAPAALRPRLATPCRISHVCRESCSVAVSRRQPVETLGLPWVGPGSWFDPRTDTVLVDCDVFKEYRAVWRLVRRALSHGPRGSRVRFGMGPDLPEYRRKGLLAEEGNADAVHDHNDHNDNDDNDDDDGEDRSGPGIRQRMWPVVVDQVWLFMTEDEACQTGRFGVFGEEHEIHISLGDDAGLKWLDEMGGRRMGGSCNTGQVARRALTRWRRGDSKFRAMSREVGFEGSEEEWRLAPSCCGPYPVIGVQWFETAAVFI